jgi:hypothetical protein
MRSRPLCPHCYRDACPWLMLYEGGALEPEPSDCPHYGHPVPPGARKRVMADIERHRGIPAYSALEMPDKVDCDHCGGSLEEGVVFPAIPGKFAGATFCIQCEARALWTRLVEER